MAARTFHGVASGVKRKLPDESEESFFSISIFRKGKKGTNVTLSIHFPLEAETKRKVYLEGDAGENVGKGNLKLAN